MNDGQRCFFYIKFFVTQLGIFFSKFANLLLDFKMNSNCRVRSPNVVPSLKRFKICPNLQKVPKWSQPNMYMNPYLWLHKFKILQELILWKNLTFSQKGWKIVFLRMVSKFGTSNFKHHFQLKNVYKSTYFDRVRSPLTQNRFVMDLLSNFSKISENLLKFQDKIYKLMIFSFWKIASIEKYS